MPEAPPKETPEKKAADHSPKAIIVKTADEFDKAVKPLNLNCDDKEKLRAIINKHTAGKLDKRKQSISNDITRQFGNNRVKKLYKAVKPLIK